MSHRAIGQHPHLTLGSVSKRGDAKDVHKAAAMTTVTGVASWWIRRPKRGVAVPRKVELRWPRGLVATAAAMCVLLPIFGTSVPLVLGLERLTAVRLKSA